MLFFDCSWEATTPSKKKKAYSTESSPIGSVEDFNLLDLDLREVRVLESFYQKIFRMYPHVQG